MTPRISLGYLIVALASALVLLGAAREASWAQAVPDLIVNPGETHTMLPGVYEYNQITISPTAMLRTTGTVSVTASRMKLQGNILLGGNASFVMNYGSSNPGTGYTLAVGMDDLINCDFQLDGRADDGPAGANGASAGEDGENGGNGSAGRSGYALTLIVHGHLVIEGSRFRIDLSGQDGGNGGRGGNGNMGLDGGMNFCSMGGDGGAGATGGSGGTGGNGGSLTINCDGDVRFGSPGSSGSAALELKLAGGRGGSGGDGGDAGRGGTGAGAGVNSCTACAGGGNGGAPGIAGRGSDGGRGGTITLQAANFSRITAHSGGISVNGGYAGSGGTGGDGGHYGYPGTSCYLCSSCNYGLGQQGEYGAAGGRGGAAGKIHVKSAGELYSGIDFSNNPIPFSFAADGGSGGVAGGAGGPGAMPPLDCQNTELGLDGVNIASLGGAGGEIRITAAAHAAYLQLEATGGRGGDGSSGGSIYINGCPRGQPGDGGDGGNGGNGGWIWVLADTVSMAAPSNVSGGSGGLGGAGGTNSLNGDLTGEDGIAGTHGANGILGAKTHGILVPVFELLLF